jgi:hypothetical protein
MIYGLAGMGIYNKLLYVFVILVCRIGDGLRISG